MLLKNQYLLSLDRANLRECTRYYMKVLGIPCAHIICCHIDTKSTLKLNHLPSNGNWTPLTTSIMKSSEFCHPFAFKRSKVTIGRTKKQPSVYFRASNTWRGNLVSGSVSTAMNPATTDAGVPRVSSSSLPSTLKRPSKSAYPQVYRPSSSLYLRCRSHRMLNA